MHIRKPTREDLDDLVALSAVKRAACARVLPVFWRTAADADTRQRQYFEYVMGDDSHLMLLAESDAVIRGFVIARIMNAPPVYDPGGKTALVDDFCVENAGAWASIGIELMQELARLAEPLGVTQIVAICAHYDKPKRSMLDALGHEPASDWLVRDLSV